MWTKVKRTPADRLSEGLWLRAKGDDYPERLSDRELLDILEALPVEEAAEAVRFAYDKEPDEE